MLNEFINLTDKFSLHLIEALSGQEDAAKSILDVSVDLVAFCAQHFEKIADGLELLLRAGFVLEVATAVKALSAAVEDDSNQIEAMNALASFTAFVVANKAEIMVALGD